VISEQFNLEPKGSTLLFFNEVDELTKTVLLVGMNSFDSGKTELAKSLIAAFTKTGQAVEYFKPLSGHNYWYHYEHTKTCLEKGQLVSRDAENVRSTFNPKSPVELANPVHRLSVPLRIERPLQTLPNTLGLAGSSSILTMQRFSRPSGSGIDTTVLLAQELVEADELIIGLEEIGKLTKGAAILEVNNIETVQQFENAYFEQYISESFKIIEKLSDVVVIEGFNDAAWPWDNLEFVDAVLVVGPGHVFSYDPDKFRKAAYLMIRGNLPIREVTFSRMADLLKPIGRVELTPETDLTESDMKELGLDFHTGKKD
jgi:predicted P-loop ATPase/GTPase